MSSMFDIIWFILCLLWAVKTFKAFKKTKKKGINHPIQRGRVGLIGKEVFEEIRSEMVEREQQNDITINLRPLQCKTEKRETNEGHKHEAYFEEENTESSTLVKKGSKFNPLFLSLRDIKRGIIMAEILGPPKAKRNCSYYK